jgi:hypothetical protein
MDDDLRNAFATLSAQISVVDSGLRANTALTAELTRGVADVRSEQREIRGEVKVLQKAVFGSEPPPAPAARPMAHSINEHDGEIAEVKGELIAVRSELAKQSKTMGVDKTGFWGWVRGATVQDAMKLGTMLAAVIAAIAAALKGLQ